jgi:hypothetical protein
MEPSCCACHSVSRAIASLPVDVRVDLSDLVVLLQVSTDQVEQAPPRQSERASLQPGKPERLGAMRVGHGATPEERDVCAKHRHRG